MLLIALIAVAYVILLRASAPRPTVLSGHLYLTTATKDTFIPLPVVLDLATGASATPSADATFVSNFDSFSADGSQHIFVGVSKDGLDAARTDDAP